MRDIGSSDVNDYLREATGQNFTAKNFRTWAATVLAACALQEMRAFRSQTQAKRQIAAAIEAVAGLLGHTPSICRTCYVHPAIVEAYVERTLPRRKGAGTLRAVSSPGQDFRRMETAVLGLLVRRAQRSTQRRTA